MKYKKSIPIALGIIIGAFSIWVGTYEPFWQALSIPDKFYVNGQLSVALSILFLLLGFYISIYIEQQGQSHNFNKIKEILSNKNYLEEFTGEDALRDLSKNLIDAVSVFNTKIYPQNVKPDTTIESMSYWHKIVDKSIRNGIQFTEILSPSWEQYAIDRAKGFTKLKRRLDVFILKNSDIPLINFTIVSTKTEKTIWFGWTSPDYSGFINPCYKSKDKRFINLFEGWFKDLSKVSKKL